MEMEVEVKTKEEGSGDENQNSKNQNEKEGGSEDENQNSENQNKKEEQVEVEESTKEESKSANESNEEGSQDKIEEGSENEAGEKKKPKKWATIEHVDRLYHRQAILRFAKSLNDEDFQKLADELERKSHIDEGFTKTMINNLFKEIAQEKIDREVRRLKKIDDEEKERLERQRDLKIYQAEMEIKRKKREKLRKKKDRERRRELGEDVSDSEDDSDEDKKEDGANKENDIDKEDEDSREGEGNKEEEQTEEDSKENKAKQTEEDGEKEEQGQAGKEPEPEKGQEHEAKEKQEELTEEQKKEEEKRLEEERIKEEKQKEEEEKEKQEHERKVKEQEEKDRLQREIDTIKWEVKNRRVMPRIRLFKEMERKGVFETYKLQKLEEICKDSGMSEEGLRKLTHPPINPAFEKWKEHLELSKQIPEDEAKKFKLSPKFIDQIAYKIQEGKICWNRDEEQVPTWEHLKEFLVKEETRGIICSRINSDYKLLYEKCYAMLCELIKQSGKSDWYFIRQCLQDSKIDNSATIIESMEYMINEKRREKIEAEWKKEYDRPMNPKKNKKLDEELKRRLAWKLDDDWKRLARHIGGEDAESNIDHVILGIDRDYEELYEKSYQTILHLFKNAKDGILTWDMLKPAILKIDRLDVASHFEWYAHIPRYLDDYEPERDLTPEPREIWELEKELEELKEQHKDIIEYDTAYMAKKSKNDDADGSNDDPVDKNKGNIDNSNAVVDKENNDDNDEKNNANENDEIGDRADDNISKNNESDEKYNANENDEDVDQSDDNTNKNKESGEKKVDNANKKDENDETSGDSVDTNNEKDENDETSGDSVDTNNEKDENDETSGDSVDTNNEKDKNDETSSDSVDTNHEKDKKSDADVNPSHESGDIKESSIVNTVDANTGE